MSLASPASSASVPAALSALAEKARGQRQGGLNYAGEVTADETYAYVKAHGGVVVDVRTLPEWQFVGVPDLSDTKAELLTLCWKLYPDFSTNPRFAEQLADAPGVSADAPLFFICRTGGRSLDAAVAMTARGYGFCFNVTDGFEGEPDASGHRGVRSGWKALNLPWKQG